MSRIELLSVKRAQLSRRRRRGHRACRTCMVVPRCIRRGQRLATAAAANIQGSGVPRTSVRGGATSLWQLVVQVPRRTETGEVSGRQKRDSPTYPVLMNGCTSASATSAMPKCSIAVRPRELDRSRAKPTSAASFGVTRSRVKGCDSHQPWTGPVPASAVLAPHDVVCPRRAPVFSHKTPEELPFTGLLATPWVEDDETHAWADRRRPMGIGPRFRHT